MELKAGYKQTEVGIIPEDWDVKTLKDLSVLITKGTTPKRFTDAGITYVKIESLTGDEINIEKCLFIDGITHKTDLKRSILNEGDLLFAIAGATIGKCTIVPKEIIPANTNQALAIIRLKQEENKMYVFYFLKSTLMQKYIIENIAGGAQPNLNLAQVGSYFFPIPPTKTEQTAIATALSDTDALINALDKLIAKKRLIKQGAMQKLLSGKKRLAGFSGEWEVKKLGDLITYKNGKSFENFIVEDGDYFLITLNSIDIKGKLKKEHLKIKQFDNSLEKDDLVIVLSDVAHGNFLGLTDVIPESGKYVLNQRMGALKKLTNIIPRFLSLYINHYQAYFKMSGKGSSQQNLGKDDILNFQIKLPKLEEQTAIAQILSDMDNEIAALETELAKIKNIKLGMMQELLTGKTRLINPAHLGEQS